MSCESADFARGRRNLVERMARLHQAELLFIGEVDPQRRDGNIAALDRPQVRSFLVLRQGNDGKPVVLATHGILPGNDLAVVELDRLPRPEHALGVLVREIHVYERERSFLEQRGEHFPDRWLERLEIRLVLRHGYTECESAPSYHCRIIRGGR